MATKLILVRRQAFVSVIAAYAGIHLLEPTRNANLDAGVRGHDSSGSDLVHAMAEAAGSLGKLAKEVLWN